MSTEFVEEEDLQTKMSNGGVGPDDPDRSIEVDGPVASSDTLPSVFRSFFDGVVYSDGASKPLIRRVRDATSAHLPRLPDASRNSAKDLVAWTRSGSALRALFVISVSSEPLCYHYFCYFYLRISLNLFNCLCIVFNINRT